MTHTLAHELRQAGFPQPSPFSLRAGQTWYDDEDICVVIDFNEGKDIWPTDEGALNEEMNRLAFAPTLDDIAPHLPHTFALEYWDGKPSCTNRDDANPLRTFGGDFAEAAGRMWLETKKPAP